LGVAASTATQSPIVRIRMADIHAACRSGPSHFKDLPAEAPSTGGHVPLDAPRTKLNAQPTGAPVPASEAGKTMPFQSLRRGREDSNRRRPFRVFCNG
jgi:hypothetical protein